MGSLLKEKEKGREGQKKKNIFKNTVPIFIRFSELLIVSFLYKLFQDTIINIIFIVDEVRFAGGNFPLVMLAGFCSRPIAWRGGGDDFFF
jgi:hypothetical protein